MKKTVLKLDLHDDKDKRKALKTATTLPGIDSISMDMKERKMTVMGVVDPLDIVKKLRRYWKVEIFSVGAPPKEGGGGGGGGDGGDKKKNPNLNPMDELIKASQAYYNRPYIPYQYYYTPRIDENPPDNCVIS